MTSFLRFFILSLTPLLAVTVSFGPAVLYGLIATLVLLAAATLVFFLRGSLKESGLLWCLLGLGVVLVTGFDFAVGFWLPEVRKLWGLYLNLLAFSPLVMNLAQEKPESPDLADELTPALKTGILLTGLFALTAFLRETLGLGTLTILPHVASWSLPGLQDFPLTILVTGAGGFFLAAVGVVGYRLLRPQWLKAFTADQVGAPREKPVEAAKPVPPPPLAPEPLLPPEATEWGEDLPSVVKTLAEGSQGKRRLLVIGSGNGELAYFLSMLCLEQAKDDKGFDFRIRGVDHFSTRIETAVKGVYRDHQIEFIPVGLRDTWMTLGQGGDRQWRVNNEPRMHVQFEVADFQRGPLFFSQPCHLIVLNQGIEYVSDDKKVQLLKAVCEQLVPGAALVMMGAFRRELLPEGMKRTGASVFRRS